MTADRPGYAYLGPRGTFAEAALAEVTQGADVEPLPQPHVAGALEAVRSGLAAAAVVPFENSVEGVVPATVDDLAFGVPLAIVGEVALPVRFGLLVRPGTTLDDVKRVASHPHGLAQCREWLETMLPEAEAIPVGSTAGAAELVAEGADGLDAAISAPVAAQAYALEVLADGIGDNDEAWTRFLVVERPGRIPAPTGADKTTLCLFQRDNHSGALMEILTEFAMRGVNLTRIESRPTRRALGDYYFSIDFEGHVADARVAETLRGLHRRCAQVRFLGSYPRQDGRTPALPLGVSDEDFAEAQTWLASLQAPLGDVP